MRSSTNSSTSGSCASSPGWAAPTTNCPTTRSSGRYSPTAPNVGRRSRAVTAGSRSSLEAWPRCSSSDSSRIASASTRAATPSRRSSSGRPLQREVENPGDVERFQVVGSEQPTVVVVEPSEGTLNAFVTLTNSRKALSRRGPAAARRIRTNRRAGRSGRPPGRGGQLEGQVDRWIRNHPRRTRRDSAPRGRWARDGQRVDRRTWGRSPSTASTSPNPWMLSPRRRSRSS